LFEHRSQEKCNVKKINGRKRYFRKSAYRLTAIHWPFPRYRYKCRYMTFWHYSNTTLPCELTRLIWLRFRIQPLSLNTRRIYTACDFFVWLRPGTRGLQLREEYGTKKIFKFEIVRGTMKADTENAKHECWCKTRTTSKADWKISRNTLWIIYVIHRP